MKIKAWITRKSAFSIQCGGLERLFIHWSKPMYMYVKYTAEERDGVTGCLPFDDPPTEKQGLFRHIGWEDMQKTWVHKQSVGNWLGYENEVGQYIWSKLEEHFLNEPFESWDRLEKEGKCKIEDFLLEIELSITIPVITG